MKSSVVALSVVSFVLIFVCGQTTAVPKQQPKKAKAAAGKKVPNKIAVKTSNTTNPKDPVMKSEKPTFQEWEKTLAITNMDQVPVTPMAWSHDNNSLALGGKNSFVVWDIAGKEWSSSGKKLRVPQEKFACKNAHTNFVFNLKYGLPNGRVIFSNAQDGDVKVWNAENGNLLNTINPGVPSRSIQTKDGRWVILIPLDSVFEKHKVTTLTIMGIGNNETPNEQVFMRLNHGEMIRDVYYNTTTSTLSSIGPAVIREWMVGNPTPVKTIPVSDMPNGMFVDGNSPYWLFHPRGQNIIRSFDGLNTFTFAGPVVKRGEKSHRLLVNKAVSPNAKVVAGIHERKIRGKSSWEILVWRSPDEAPETLSPQHAEISDVKFIDDETVVTASDDGKARIIRLGNNPRFNKTKMAQEIITKPNSRAGYMVVSPDRKKIAVGVVGYGVVILEKKSG